jgi:uncharacterized metal-binding protein YceD (DUF177 family)
MFSVSTRPLNKEPVGAVLPFTLGSQPLGEGEELLAAAGTVTKLQRGFLVHLEARWRRETACDRCLDPVVLLQDGSIEEVFGPDEALDERPVVEGLLDLGPLLAELLVLEEPVKVLCSAECRGLCPVCGQNRNHGTCSCETETIDPRLARLMDWRGDR